LASPGSLIIVSRHQQSANLSDLTEVQQGRDRWIRSTRLAQPASVWSLLWLQVASAQDSHVGSPAGIEFVL